MQPFAYFIAIALSITACSGNYKGKPAPPVEKLEMIFGQEKKDLESFISHIDSLVANVDNLPVDTLNYEKGSVQRYIVYDSLMNTEGAKDIYQSDVIRQELNDANLEKTSVNYLEFEYVLKAKIKHASYSTYLEDLKKINHIIYIKTISFLLPKEEGNDSFTGGFALGVVYLIDTKLKKVVSVKVLQAESSTQVESTSLGLSQSVLNIDFWKNYRSEQASAIYSILN